MTPIEQIIFDEMMQSTDPEDRKSAASRILREVVQPMLREAYDAGYCAGDTWGDAIGYAASVVDKLTETKS